MLLNSFYFESTLTFPYYKKRGETTMNQICRLIVLLDEKPNEITLNAMNQLCAYFTKNPAPTFICGLTKEATLPLMQAWPKVFYNAEEFLNFTSDAVHEMMAFKETYYVRSGTIFKSALDYLAPLPIKSTAQKKSFCKKTLPKTEFRT